MTDLKMPMAPDTSAKNPNEYQPLHHKHLMNYRRIWQTVVFLTGCVALIPLIFITVVDYQVTQHAIKSEFMSRTTRVLSNTHRGIAFFLAERKSALNFIVHDNSPTVLADSERLTAILENLHKSFGSGFVDLGLIDGSGHQVNYVGPYALQGKNYRDQAWFHRVLEHGEHISETFLGYRNEPHFVIAVSRKMTDGSVFILRSAIGSALFEVLVSQMDLEGKGNAFLINHAGILQTPSVYYGGVLEKIPFPIPAPSNQAEVYLQHIAGRDMVIGYRFIENTPFILMIIKDQAEMMKPWLKTRSQLIAFLIGSITVILTVIFWTSSFMIQKIKSADQRRIKSLHQVEYANKMASIGRLAASVAHEINNPLAIINEKAGLLKDLFLIKEEYRKDEKLIGIVDAITGCVKRAGKITKRLLTFAGKFESAVVEINLREVLEGGLEFYLREASHRSIDLQLDMAEDVGMIMSDLGKLQQVFVNIINNAFAAVGDGGSINIIVRNLDTETVAIQFKDTGCGIPQEDINRIFEPFFSTRAGKGGTGLGLSITLNLIQEVGGRIKVESEVGKGTEFTVILPRKMPLEAQQSSPGSSKAV
jgi:two-component system, NtrC family, sensor kinase